MSGEKSLLQPRILRAPEFKPGEWLNSERPLTMAGLRVEPYWWTSGNIVISTVCGRSLMCVSGVGAITSG